MSIAEKLLEELRQREDLRDALAQELIPSIARDRRMRFLLASAIIREVATKDDLAEVETRLRDEIARLREDIGKAETRLNSRIDRLEDRIDRLEDRLDRLGQNTDALEQRISSLEGTMGLFVKLFVAFNVPVLIGVVGILLKMALAP